MATVKTALYALLLLLSGCAPSPWKWLNTGAPTEELMRAGLAPIAELPTPEGDDTTSLQSTTTPCTTLTARLDGEPKRLPNPSFTLHIARRVLGQSLIPAYQTHFHLYLPPTPWALPEEVGDCSTGRTGRNTRNVR